MIFCITYIATYGYDYVAILVIYNRRPFLIHYFYYLATCSYIAIISKRVHFNISLMQKFSLYDVCRDNLQLSKVELFLFPHVLKKVVYRYTTYTCIDDYGKYLKGGVYTW